MKSIENKFGSGVAIWRFERGVLFVKGGSGEGRVGRGEWGGANPNKKMGLALG